MGGGRSGVCGSVGAGHEAAARKQRPMTAGIWADLYHGPAGSLGLEFPESSAQTLGPSIRIRLGTRGPSSTWQTHLGFPPGLGHSRCQATCPFSEDHMEPRDSPGPSPGLQPQGNRAAHQLHLRSFWALEASLTRVILSVSGLCVTLPECPGCPGPSPHASGRSLSPTGLPPSAE